MASALLAQALNGERPALGGAAVFHSAGGVRALSDTDWIAIPVSVLLFMTH
jgi:hypothetical protein